MSWNLTKKLETQFAGPGEIKRREVVLDSHKKLDTFAGPSETKRRKMCWNLTKKLDTQFAGPGEIKRRQVVLDPQVSPDRRE